VVDSGQHGANSFHLVSVDLQHIHCAADFHPRLRLALPIFRSLQWSHERVRITEIIQMQFFPVQQSNITSELLFYFTHYSMASTYIDLLGSFNCNGRFQLQLFELVDGHPCVSAEVKIPKTETVITTRSAARLTQSSA